MEHESDKEVSEIDVSQTKSQLLSRVPESFRPHMQSTPMFEHGKRQIRRPARLLDYTQVMTSRMGKGRGVVM